MKPQTPGQPRQEFVFGRVLRRMNLELQVLGKLQFADDGTVQGYRHPNEEFWSTADGQLCFASPRGITTRFDERLQIGNVEVMTGRCLVAGYEHFLYPYVPLASVCRIQYAVSSHVNYRTARDGLLPQLRAAGIPPEAIRVTIAGAPRREIRTVDGITFSEMPENAFEYTALIDAATRDLAADYVFLLHDTCHAGPRFRQLVENQPGTLPIDYISVLATGWFNIGLYSRQFLQLHRDYLKSLNGISKKAAIEIELNHHEMGFKRRAGLTSNFLCSKRPTTGIHHPYGDLPRRGMYLEGADLHKFYGMNHAVARP